MATLDSQPKRPLEGLDIDEVPQRKRFKISELPLTTEQRATIDGLVHTIKKKGIYDSLRHKILAEYKESAEKAAFTKSLHEFGDTEIDRNPTLLAQRRHKAALLLQGAVDRSSVYQEAENAFGDLIHKCLGQVEDAAREVRVVEIGEEAAVAEQRKGKKTDDEYAQIAAAREAEMTKTREQEEKKRMREEQKEALRMEEMKKMKELEKLRQAEERRKEREARKAAMIKSTEERRAKYDQMREQQEARGGKGKDAAKKADAEPTSITPSSKVPADDELTQIALDELLREVKETQDTKEKTTKDDGHGDPSIPTAKTSIFDRPPNSVTKQPHSGPKLSYSSTHKGAPQFPPPLKTGASRDRSRSPLRQHGSNGERTPSSAHPESAKYHQQHRGSWAWMEDDVRGGRKVRRPSLDDAQSHGSHLHDATRDSSRKGHHYERENEQDWEYERPRARGGGYKDYEERKPSVSEAVPRKVDVDPHTGKARGSLADPRPDIDRYIPGGGGGGGSAAPKRPRERDRERDRDRDRERDRERDRDRERRQSRDHHGDRDRGRDYDKDRPRHKNRDRERDYDKERHRDRGRERRDYYEKESHRAKDDYRTSHRDRDRDREGHGRTKPRSEKPPNDIDRYVPGK